VAIYAGIVALLPLDAPQARKAATMRNAIYVTGALLVAAAIFAWSHAALVAPHANTASTVGLGLRAAPAPEDPAVDPSRMMRDGAGGLHAEEWDAH
jgi:hypothetical protein